MPMVVARETFPYDGITRVAGDRFGITNVEDARILLLMGRVAEVPDVEVASIESFSTEPAVIPKRTRRRDHALDTADTLSK